MGTEYPVTTHTAKGWPYMVDNDFLRVLPAYTKEIADKLENGEGNVAAVIDAANKVKEQIAAAQLQAPFIEDISALQASPAIPGDQLVRLNRTTIGKGLWWLNAWWQMPETTATLMEIQLTCTGVTTATSVGPGNPYYTIAATMMVHNTTDTRRTVELFARIRGGSAPRPHAGNLQAVRIR